MARQGIIAITGASRGIGAAIARELAERGFTVGCLTRAGDGIQEGEVPAALAGRMLPVKCDVTDDGALGRAFEVLTNSGQPLIGLVNNAGYHVEAPSKEFGTEDFEAVLRTNTTAVFAAAREAYPYLARQGGLIVNLGSFWDKLGVKRAAAYCASKAAVAAITRCLSAEWAADGISVLNVAPGYIVTDMNRDMILEGPLAEKIAKRNPVRRPGEADEVAQLVGALYAEAIPFLTGQTIYIDGGHNNAL
jgi:NAD(P)-dependent dehydrogenase (short-subunit alcohol dehydrogenase family)